MTCQTLALLNHYMFLVVFAWLMNEAFNLYITITYAAHQSAPVNDQGSQWRSYLLGYLMRVWLFLSPVLYSVDEIPESARKFMVLNPLYPFFSMLDPMFSGDPVPLRYLPWCAAWAVAALVVGLWVFLSGGILDRFLDTDRSRR